MNYEIKTVGDLVRLIKDNKDIFPDGMKTKIFTGDTEGNYVHAKHFIQYSKTEKNGNVMFLAYEMHEDFEE